MLVQGLTDLGALHRNFERLCFGPKELKENPEIASPPVKNPIPTSLSCRPRLYEFFADAFPPVLVAPGVLGLWSPLSSPHTNQNSLLRFSGVSN